MKKLFLILTASFFLMSFSACHRTSKDDSSCGYCDDSGCWGCEGDYCWPIDNEPCGDSGEVCSDGYICTDFGCAQLCEFDADCSLGESCLSSGYCSPTEAPETKCVTDEDCGNGTICEYDSAKDYYVCVPGCSSDDECGEDEVCASCGRCVPKENPVCGDSKVFCESNEECGVKVCSVDQKCALTCDTSNPVCPTGQICSEGVCIDDPAPANPECAFSSQCASGQVCLNAYCHNTCESDSECGFGEFCDIGVCKPDYRPQFEEK